MLLMDVKDLLSVMNWKSLSAFFRHYLTLTSRPQQPIAVPGELCATDDDVDDPVPNALVVASSA